MKIAIGFLFVLLGTLAYFAAIYRPSVQDEIDKEWKGCPNVMHKIQVPWPTPPPGGMEQLVAAADEPWIINGKAVGKPVKVAQLDQETKYRVQMRKIYGIHE